MNDEPLLRFLGEKSILLHKEYLSAERARLSIFEKSVPKIKGCTLSEIYAMRSLCREDKRELLTHLVNIAMHELYFSSFTSAPMPCKEIKEYYSSENAFLYEALLLGKGKRRGFLYFYRDRRGKPVVGYTESGVDVLVSKTPILAVDLCEHAYFLDYGFDSGEYLRRALGFLDIARLVAKS